MKWWMLVNGTNWWSPGDRRGVQGIELEFFLLESPVNKVVVRRAFEDPVGLPQTICGHYSDRRRHFPANGNVLTIGLQSWTSPRIVERIVFNGVAIVDFVGLIEQPFKSLLFLSIGGVKFATIVNSEGLLLSLMMFGVYEITLFRTILIIMVLISVQFQVERPVLSAWRWLMTLALSLEFSRV